MDLAVVDPLPMYRQGVDTVLSAAGHTVVVPDDPLAWARRGRPGVMLLTMADGSDWTLLQQLRGVATRLHVIAVLAEPSAPVGARAVRAGASSVLFREMTAEALRRTVAAAIDGQAVLPADVVDALRSGPAHGPDGDAPLSAEQMSWLRHLAAGMTVAQLARIAGYSERAMFRLLQSLYRRLGVRTRIEAIVHAQERGWLESAVGPRKPP